MASNEINIEKILLILRIRLWWVGGIFLGAIFLTALVTYQTPRMYLATTSLNFDFSGNNPLDSRGRSVLSLDSYLTTQVGILQSLNIAQQVVDSFTPYERERVVAALDASHSAIETVTYRTMKFIKSLFSGHDKEVDDNELQREGAELQPNETLSVSSRYDWLAGALGSDLVVDPQVDSRIVKISYYSPDPQVAALLADRFAEAYITANLRMVIDPARKTKVWFDQQLKLLRAQLEEAQGRLTAYQQKEGIVSSDQRIDIETTNLRGLADQLAEAQQARRNAETEQTKLNEVLKKDASLLTFEPVFDKPVVQKIKSEMRDLESRLAEGSTGLGPNHPTIKKLKSELAAANGRLQREIQAIVDGINHNVELTREREQTLEAALTKQKQLVLRLKSEHDKIAVLEREVESAQANYNAGLNQLNTTSMQSMVDQTNVSIIDHASVPSQHAIPRVTQNLAIGAFGGLLLGIGLVLGMEIFRRRVHTEEDVVSELGIPLLGNLGKYETGRTATS